MNKKSKFCVITTGRSGSTWLRSLLDSHPQIRMFGEPFLWRKEKRGWPDEEFLRYYDYRQANATLRPWVMFKYLDNLEHYQSVPHDTIGFKMMYIQIIKDPEFLFKIIQDKYRVIHLARRNHLDVLISKTVGKQYNVFHVNNSDSKTRKVTLNTASLVRTLDIYEAMYRVAKTFLKFSPLEVMEVQYESLKADPETNLGAIADFLGVDSNKIVTQSNYKKVNPGSYADKITNYEEVVKTLEKSKYAHFLN